MEAESIKIVDIPDTLLDPQRWCINNDADVTANRY